MGTFRVEVTLKPQSENNSGGQPLSDGRIERFSGQVMREAQDVATADPGQPTGASYEQEAQRSHAADQVGIGAFARARFGRREGVELEPAGEIVSQDAELLPGTVGAVVVGRHDIEREFSLEFRDGLLLRPAAADERVQ